MRLFLNLLLSHNDLTPNLPHMGGREQLVRVRDALGGKDVNPLNPYLDVDFIHLRGMGTQCCCIEGAQNRAMSVRQLQRLQSFIESYSADDGQLPWRDRFSGSPTFQQALHISTINLYQLNDWVIKPATASDHCSLVEYMCDEDTVQQNPHW